jgi:hypothetical protein
MKIDFKKLLFFVLAFIKRNWKIVRFYLTSYLAFVISSETASHGAELAVYIPLKEIGMMEIVFGLFMIMLIFYRVVTFTQNILAKNI